MIEISFCSATWFNRYGTQVSVIKRLEQENAKSLDSMSLQNSVVIDFVTR